LDQGSGRASGSLKNKELHLHNRRCYPKRLEKHCKKVKGIEKKTQHNRERREKKKKGSRKNTKTRGGGFRSSCTKQGNRERGQKGKKGRNKFAGGTKTSGDKRPSQQVNREEKLGGKKNSDVVCGYPLLEKRWAD